jgi:hypothetical protein
MLECEVCPRNSVGPGATGLSGCICAAGMEMRNTTCQPCRAGTYSDRGVCLPCRNGTFSGNAGASVCLPCPSSTTSGPGSTACTVCEAGNVPSQDGGSCTPCPAGYYCGVGVVMPCPLGSYSLKTGLALKTQCQPCPANYFCRTPTTIHPCPPNTWSPTGSTNRHFCQCNAGFRCIYFMTDTKAIRIIPH